MLAFRSGDVREGDSDLSPEFSSKRECDMFGDFGVQ